MILSSIQFKFILGLFICSSYSIIAQTSSTNRNVYLNLPEIALLDVEPVGTTISFSLNTPTDAGRPVTVPVANTTKWLNYTSALRASSPRRIVTAQIDQLFPGITLKIRALPAIGGGGALGISTGTIVLNTIPSSIISGIGGSFTGNGVNNGHQLQLFLEITDYNQLVRTLNKIITVTYTISN